MADSLMSTPPVSRVVKIVNEQGFHARPASDFAKLALGYQSHVMVNHRGRRVDGKSPIDLLTMGATQGTELTIEASGPDAAEAVEALAKLVESGFPIVEKQKAGQNERGSGGPGAVPQPPQAGNEKANQ
jgi:phosphotransferase system HPr (HPr) family protein